MSFTRCIPFVLLTMATLSSLDVVPRCTSFPIDHSSTELAIKSEPVTSSLHAEEEDGKPPQSMVVDVGQVRKKRMNGGYQNQAGDRSDDRGYREPDEQNSITSSGTLTIVVLICVFIGMLCLCKKYNLCPLWDSVEDLDTEARRSKRKKKSKSNTRRNCKDNNNKGRRSKKDKKRRKRKRADSDSDTDSDDEVSSSEDSSDEDDSLANSKHRRDKHKKRHKSETKSALIRKLKKLKKAKRNEEEEDDERKRHKKNKKGKAPPVADSTDSTAPLTGDNLVTTEPTTVGPSTTSPTTTYTDHTTPVSTPTVLPARPEPVAQAQPVQPPIQDNQPKSAGSEYAYVVYRPDTNYVAVSRSLKNLIPPNTNVIYKVDDTSNQTEAGSIMKSLKSCGSMRMRYPSEPSTLSTSDSPPWKHNNNNQRVGSPTSVKSVRSRRSNYYIINSDLLLKKNDQRDQQDQKRQLATATVPPSAAQAESKTTETVFVYSTKAQLTKMPQYPAPKHTPPTPQPKVQLTQPIQLNRPQPQPQTVQAHSEGTFPSGLHARRETQPVRFSSQPSPDEDASEDDSDSDNGDAMRRRQKRKHKKVRHERDRHRLLGTKARGLAQSGQQSPNVSLALEVDDNSEDNSDDSGDDDGPKRKKHNKERDRAVLRRKERKRSSARGADRDRRKGLKKRRHSSVRLPGSLKDKNRKLKRHRRTRRHDDEDEDED